MKKLFLTLLFIFTFFIINSVSASYDCNKTITIDKSGGKYDICGGLLNLDIPAGAVNNSSTLLINDNSVKLNYNGGYFEIIGIGDIGNNGPAFLNFSLKNSNGNEVNFSKGIKATISINSKLMDYLGVLVNGEGNSFNFYKDGYKLVVQGSKTVNEKYTISNTNNFELDKNNKKVYLSDITNINGIFAIVSFLPKSIETFKPSSYINNMKNMYLDEIKGMIINKKTEILGYEKILGISRYSFYDDEQKYNSFLSIYKNNSLGTDEDFSNLENFYNDLNSRFYGIYNNLRNSSEEKQNTTNQSSQVINNNYDSYNNNQNNDMYSGLGLERFEMDKSQILSSIEGESTYVNDLKITLNELNKVSSSDSKYVEIKTKLTNFIAKNQETLANFKKACDVESLYSYYSNNDLEYTDSYLEKNNCYNVSNTFSQIENDFTSNNGGKSILELANNYISTYYDNLDYSNQNTNNNIEEIDLTQIPAINTYILTSKEKVAVQSIGNKINKMNNTKKIKYKNILNQYLNKFEYGSRKYEIAKGLLDLIK